MIIDERARPLLCLLTMFVACLLLGSAHAQQDVVPIEEDVDSTFQQV